MSADVINNFGSVERELEKAKTNLKDLNENIKRIFGKNETFSDRKRNSNSFESYRRSESKNYDSPPIKQQRRSEIKTKSVFSRLSSSTSNSNRDEDYEFPKQKLQSRIVKEMPSREDILQIQSGDEFSRARNKRMFGSLLGTLQKFCQEESRLKPKEEKKAQIEKKLEQQEQLEKEKMRMEKQNLFEDRKRKQLEIKALEIKMYKLRDLAAWEESKKPLVNFIRTKTKPHIYFIPKILNSKTEEKLKASKSEVDKMIEKRRKEVNDEIKEIENRYKQDIRAVEEGKMSKTEMEELDSDTPYNSDDNDNDISIVSKSVAIIKKEKDDEPNEKSNNKRHHSEDELDKELNDFLMRPIKKEKNCHENSHAEHDENDKN